MSDSPLWLPNHVAHEQQVVESLGEPTCPHARLGEYADSRRTYVHCGVAGDTFAVADQPLAASQFCCGDYTACPLVARERDDADGLDGHRRKMSQRRQDRITERQMASGLRVDDAAERELTDLLDTTDEHEELGL